MAMPEGPPYYQLVEGILHVFPSQTWRHQEVCMNVVSAISKYIDENPIGEVFHLPLDVCLDDENAFLPDVLFFTNERKSILGKRVIEGAPDFVAEILSESTAHLDKGQKRKIYARTGVKELWLVDPKLKEVAVFDLKKSAETPKGTYGEAENFTSPIFPGLSFSCAEIFKGI